MTESKILGDARRGRNVGCRKSGDVPFPRFGSTDSNSTRISRSLRSCGIRKEDDSWPAPVARNRVSICPPVPSVGRQGLTSCSAINRAAAVASFYSSFRSHLLFNFIFSAHHLRYPSAIRYLGEFRTSWNIIWLQVPRNFDCVAILLLPWHFFPSEKHDTRDSKYQECDVLAIWDNLL